MSSCPTPEVPTPLQMNQTPSSALNPKLPNLPNALEKATGSRLDGGIVRLFVIQNVIRLSNPAPFSAPPVFGDAATRNTSIVATESANILRMSFTRCRNVLNPRSRCSDDSTASSFVRTTARGMRLVNPSPSQRPCNTIFISLTKLYCPPPNIFSPSTKIETESARRNSSNSCTLPILSIADRYSSPARSANSRDTP